jgi:hypothetical protein
MSGGLLWVEAGPLLSVARMWNEEALSAIRIDRPHPPVHARNLFHLSVAMYDAWAAYDSLAVGYLYHEKHATADPHAARNTAISYAAYRLLRERYALSKNASRTLEALDVRMAALGYDPRNTSTDPSQPAGVGNRVAERVAYFTGNDGSYQERNYQDLPPELGGYIPVNAPLLTQASGTWAVDPNHWQPLAFTNALSQNNLPAELTQQFLGSQWLGVRPFALVRADPAKPWIDPGAPPHLLGNGDAQYRDEVVDLIRRSRELSADDDVVVDISPGVLGANRLGANDGSGHPLNPVTGQPYASNRVKRSDFARVLAEFWADGPDSETPPGHWNAIANRVCDHPGSSKRLGGTGALLDNLEWDVKLYFALNSALHDAACAAWSLKRCYDGWRPIEAIRFMGQRGQSSDPNDLTYDPAGLPLVPGLIEKVTFATSAARGRHAGIPIGSIAIYTWPGPPADPLTQRSAARWIPAIDWLPYQKRTFVSPSFPGFVSGHSTFSRAAAEVLVRFTGDDYFPGGLGTFVAPQDSFLHIERGPSETVELQWARYQDASDQASISRVRGGIHISADDFAGRINGSAIGGAAYALAHQYFVPEPGAAATGVVAALVLTILRMRRRPL